MIAEIFTTEQSQQIVDTILLGYNSYIAERQQKANEMAVSDGYAWTRSNHIDDAFAKAKLNFIESYERDRAGESWGYLKFTGQSSELGKVLLMIKNAYRLKQTFNPDKTSSQYLVDLSEISSSFVKKMKNDTTITPEGGIQLDIFSTVSLSDLEGVKSDFDEFFVITYETDASKQVVAISIVVLDRIEKQIILVQNLSAYIHTSGITPVVLESNEIFVEPELVEPQTFPYGIPAEKQKEAN